MSYRMKCREKYRILFLGILSVSGMAACTPTVKIEPSDKPFVVNLNVKVDHELRVKIEDSNKDLLDLEEEYSKTKTKNTTKNQRSG